MHQDEHRHDEQADADNNVADSGGFADPVIGDARQYEQDGAFSADDRADREIKEKQSLIQRLSFNEVLTALIGLASLIVSGLALMNALDTRDIKLAVGGLADMARQTKRQADIQGEQLKLLTGQRDAIVDQAKATRDASRATAISSDAIREEAKAAVLQAMATRQTAEQARQGVAVSRASLVATNRAWIAAEGLEITDVDGRAVAKFFYDNIGNSPAVDVGIAIITKVLPPKEDLVAFGGINSTCSAEPQKNVAVVYPRTQKQMWNEAPIMAGTTDIAKLGGIRIVVQGCYTYRTSNEVHHTAFCYVAMAQDYKASIANSRLCGDGNFAD